MPTTRKTRKAPRHAAGGDNADALLSPHVSDTGSRYFFNPGARHSRAMLALGGFERCNPDYFLDRAAFAYHVVEIITEGAGWARLGGGAEHALAPGCIFVCEKNTRRAMRADPERPLVKYFLCLSGRAALARLRRAGLPPNRVRTLAAQGEIRSVLEDLIRESRRPGRHAAEICDVLFELLCLKISENLVRVRHRRAKTPPSRDNFLRCKAIIDERAERLSSLDEIAREARLDASSICRLFRRHQGVSPYQYLLRRKMNIAAELLVDGGALVKEAAQRVGFSDALHFSRVFRSVHGVPPSQLQLRGGG